jgi:glycosyltransferase involved in cell wall biosynthesis
MKKILILYRELAGYFVQCVNHLSDKYQVEIDIVAYSVNADAPFVFSFSKRVNVYRRDKLSVSDLTKMTASCAYALIICASWRDKAYLKAVANRKKAKSLLGFDNQWSGSVKQTLAILYAKRFITPLFDGAFIPGQLQYNFARKMGFKHNSIVRNAYSCDADAFSSLYATRNAQPEKSIFRFVYVGRYAPEKFAAELFQVFAELSNEDTIFSNWELHAAGTGPLWDQRLQHPAIVHHGFLQQDQLYALMQSGDVFVLPSTFEPWGVVVHEFAVAGYPMILSDKIGAREAFLAEGENGFVFHAGKTDQLKVVLRKMMRKNFQDRLAMSKKSHALGMKITPDTWALALLNYIDS